MPRERKPSNQAVRVMQALLLNPAEWRYGYELSKEVGLKSGTLYPLLMRMTDEGLLQSEWHAAARPGLPPRHAYRLTQQGIAHARACVSGMAKGAERTGLARA